jgi:hypothetical protein
MIIFLFFKAKEFPTVDFPANFQKTLSYINKIFLTQGPFDGVFGFSQGGALTAILCNIIKNKPFDNKFNAINFKFAIIIGKMCEKESKIINF